MQTALAPEYRDTDAGREAEAILRKCVHCGFCTATCPTYQLLGDELDGPRGRIYLIKQVLEGEQPTRTTQLHLDRCLTCRNCETTCPSGVQYGRLIDIGRQVVEAKVPRPPAEARKRRLLKEGLTSPLFGTALRLGQSVRGLLPAVLKDKVPERRAAGAWPRRAHPHKVLLLEGCVQPAMAPNINAATARVLDAAGIECVLPRGQGCCGAVRYHLADGEGGLKQMRANIDAWWPHIERGAVEAIVINASGCGAMVKDYGHLLRHEPRYADRAAKVSELARDLSELLPYLAEALQGRTAVHESVRRRKDGSLVHVNVSTRAVRGTDGQLLYFLSSKKDVTQLKVQRDAQLLEARFRDLLESTPDGWRCVGGSIPSRSLPATCKTDPGPATP